MHAETIETSAFEAMPRLFAGDELHVVEMGEKRTGDLRRFALR